MYGENQAEYGNRSSENTSPIMDEKFFRESSKNSVRLGGGTIQDILSDTNFLLDDFSPYIGIPGSEIAEKAIKVHYLGYYLKWDPQECFYYAVENTGFTPNPERTEGSYSKYSSLDDKIDPFHYYTTYIKFGLGRASYDAAQEIRNDKITRQEGVRLVRKFDSEFPERYFGEFLDYIDTTASDFMETVDKFRSPHLWQKTEGGGWSLRNPIWTQ